MAKSKTNKVIKIKVVRSIVFQIPRDNELIELAREYARLRPGLNVKTAIRNFILTKLPMEIEAIKKSLN